MPLNRAILKSYAPTARREFIQAVTDRAKVLGLSETAIEPVVVQGDVAIIGGRPFSKDVAQRRVELEALIKLKGFEQVMEEVAYTWFNRFVALRFMELHDYLEHGCRVLSNPSSSDVPEILEKATSVDLPGLDKAKVVELRLAGDKDSELYRLLLVRQCNHLNRSMPFLFERLNDSTELLLPENLLQTSSPIRRLVTTIPDEDWAEIEIVGWLYQFYISEKKDQVMGKVVKSEDIPAATQLFTPNWIVKYMVQNTLGRKWLMTYPTSPIQGKMEFYLKPAEQEPEVQAQLDALTPGALNPEELTFMDPACGSGHILVEAYDLFKEIYQERGYPTRTIPRLILEKNLFGLDIDDRAAQLARFAVLMKARADDRHILAPENPVKLNILAIQESKGLDVERLAGTLLKERVREIAPSGQQQLQLIKPVNTQATLKSVEAPGVSKDELFSLLHLFKEAKTFGSLLIVPGKVMNAIPKFELMLIKTKDWDTEATALCTLTLQAKLLSTKYDFVVANPPYMGSKGLNVTLKEYARDNYTDSKSDLFAMFIERNIEMVKGNGQVALITMQSWMFLSSYQNLRNSIVRNMTIESLLHLGARAFDSISGEVVQTAAFVISRHCVKKYIGRYERLTDGDSESEKVNILLNCKDSTYYVSLASIHIIPGQPIAYWLTNELLNLFCETKSLLDSGVQPATGFQTGDNRKFIRYWQEVSQEAVNIRWFPVNNGGGKKKWYGNFSCYVDWENNGANIKAHPSSVIRNQELYFKEGGTWNRISGDTMTVRFLPQGYLFDQSGDSFFDSANRTKYIIGFLNTKISSLLMEVLSTPFNLTSGSIGTFPFLDAKVNHEIITKYVEQLISISKVDWDTFEISWDFTSNPLLCHKSNQVLVSASYKAHSDACIQYTSVASNTEEAVNRIFIDSYGLHSTISPEVTASNITLSCNPCFRYGEDRNIDYLESLFQSDTIKELVSYSVGCMMGRYSLDEPGLIYAHSGNQGFDKDRYKTFPADDDGIVPVMDGDWFGDDATNRFSEFLKVAWSPETLEKNLKFVADSLDPKSGELPQETIRRFISSRFFKDHHLKVYKKRPIYWLFSSGKHKAFECLVYLHRYNESTLSRMRSAYVTPLQGKFAARLEYLENEIRAASSTAASRQFQKELDTLKKKQLELREFDDLLRHYADQKITLDLDDGVKVNYGKFGNLLAEVKAITGESSD